MKKSVLKPFIVPVLFGFCALFYYFGELIDWAAWDALRREFFYGIHDIHRLLFLVPIIYVSNTARIKGAVIGTMVSFIIFLPRAFFVSPFPDSLLRMILFTIGAGAIGYLIARCRNERDKTLALDVALTAERDKLLQIVDHMADGIITTGPDYRIRFNNAYMVEAFGEGAGLPCYQHLHQLDTPCQGECRLLEVIECQKIKKWECSFQDGNRYEVVAAPYVDTDGTVCQISIFRYVSQ